MLYPGRFAAWIEIRDKFLEVVTETVSHRVKKSKDCFDDNNEVINELLDQRHSDHVEQFADPTDMIKISKFLNLKSSAQRKLTEMKAEWFKRKVELRQHYADNNDTKCVYSGIYGPRSNAET